MSKTYTIINILLPVKNSCCINLLFTNPNISNKHPFRVLLIVTFSTQSDLLVKFNLKVRIMNQAKMNPSVPTLRPLCAHLVPLNIDAGCPPFK